MPRAAPARFPPHGAWPGVMRADLTAAFFDCRDTAELARMVEQNDAPAPTAMRGNGRQREPLWALETCRRFVSNRHHVVDDGEGGENIAELI